MFPIRFVCKLHAATVCPRVSRVAGVCYLTDERRVQLVRVGRHVDLRERETPFICFFREKCMLKNTDFNFQELGMFLIVTVVPLRYFILKG